MAEECDYSFNDLFVAAEKRQMSEKEKSEFLALRQEAINEQVRVLAQKAGWGTMDKIGTDGRIYRAFCPLWAPK